jgi:ABC-type phosphate/phosphonate transport system substrate-binding protein
MKSSSLSRRGLLATAATLLILFSSWPVTSQSNSRIRFAGVTLNDEAYRQADDLLVKYLRVNTQLEMSEEQPKSYGRMVRKLVDWKSTNEPYIARVTPYVYVVAEMLGAQFEILATYKNKSNGASYHSYFVVNRADFPGGPPKDAGEVMQFVKSRQKPATFVYHDKFSTSSYFLPALMFRHNHIFSMDRSIDTLTAIHSQNINPNQREDIGSSDLVRLVANNQEYLAAVWDGTKNKFVGQPENDKVYFVEISDVLPNDLLVCSGSLNKAIKDSLRAAIRKMPEAQINKGDFRTWVDINDEPDTKAALASLRHMAEQGPASVTVNAVKSAESPVSDQLLETIKHAIRLSGTELVPWDPDYHKKVDVEWKVEAIHDGAINLISSIIDTQLPPQKYEISFTDSEDLTKRIGGFIHSRMNRICYVWPYEDQYPTVIRDADFPISANDQVKVMPITWTNPDRNEFSEGDPFDATVMNSTPFGFRLSESNFPKSGDGFGFDPMGNISYRVILLRPTKESWVFTTLTYAFVGLLVLAAIGGVIDMRRRLPKLNEVPVVSTDLFNQSCRRLADTYRGLWRQHRLAEADVLWCDRSSLEKLIADLKASGVFPDFDKVVKRTRGLALLANIPVISKLLGLTIEGGVKVERTINAADVSDTQRLGDTIKFLVDKDVLSPFISEQIEWKALNHLAYQIFEPVSANTSAAGLNGDGLVRSEHPILLSLVARHFHNVIEESKQKVCFFDQSWQVEENETGKVLACTSVLPSPLKWNGGSSTVKKLSMRVQVPREAELVDLSQSTEVRAWVLGKIHRVEVSKNGEQTLFLNFRPTALVKIDDSE